VGRQWGERIQVYSQRMTLEFRYRRAQSQFQVSIFQAVTFGIGVGTERPARGPDLFRPLWVAQTWKGINYHIPCHDQHIFVPCLDKAQINHSCLKIKKEKLETVSLIHEFSRELLKQLPKGKS
jgi:hypothetical protein